ncbi:hypothetical protein CDD81_1224 [Ophiocordyceps australis]|uniref:DnaJ homolog 1, mitochondrial n=1 Tax=Ophiocordyceps australis TaxID=1399860 RepID=A0A2C5Y8P9_9HYPO|nr:hypothetical protein CDD81_1224 [Ophiocordyceps australis]
MKSALVAKAVAPVRVFAQSNLVRRPKLQDCIAKGARIHTAAFCLGPHDLRPAYCARRHRTPSSPPSSPKRSFHATRSLSFKDPYQTLGVQKSASAAEVKKAYYGLAKKYHPDTNKDPTAKDHFAEIQSAYEILSDANKRQQYDKFGAAAFDPSAGGSPGDNPFGGGNPFKGDNPFGGGNPFAGFSGQGGFGGGFNFEDIFSAFAGQQGGPRGRAAQEILVGEDIEVQVNVTLADAAKGAEKSITLTPLVACSACTGTGLKSGAKRSSCKACGGTGNRVHFMQGGFQMASTCGTCEGTGTSIPRGSECRTCSGNGVVRERRTISVDIPAGIEDGMRLKVGGAGDAPPTGRVSQATRSQPGDLYVLMRVAKDPRFGRDGPNLLYTAMIPVTTAMLGGQVSVPTLDSFINVKVATGTTHGTKITVPGLGFKKLNQGRRSETGSLIIEFRVTIPKYLSSNQRTLVEMLANELGDKTARRVTNFPSSSPTSSSNPESHKTEGFLKSIWHTLTNHPAHQTHEQDADSTKTSENTAKDGQKKSKSSDQDRSSKK